MKHNLIVAHLQTAFVYSKLSKATRLKVGCIIVKDNRIISIGYNGTPSGFDNTCEDDNNVTKPEVLHAETNAITKLARSNESGEGSFLFCTHQPCLECSKLIYQSGIKEVYYNEKYRDNSGTNFLKKAGIKTIQIENIYDNF